MFSKQEFSGNSENCIFGSDHQVVLGSLGFAGGAPGTQMNTILWKANCIMARETRTKFRMLDMSEATVGATLAMGCFALFGECGAQGA
jgi:hypothetical protein